MNRDLNDLFDRQSVFCEAQAFKEIKNRDLNGKVVMIIDFAIVFPFITICKL